MSPTQTKRAHYSMRLAKHIAAEAQQSHFLLQYYRVVRKTHEALETWVKAKLLSKEIEPAKSHDLNSLFDAAGECETVLAKDLEFLTQERIPSFYGADDFIPDEEYTAEDSERCLQILRKVGLIK